MKLSAVPDAPRRGVALVRVSKVGGREDLASPEIQRVSIEDYARRHGIVVVEVVEALDESASRSQSAWWPRLERAVAQVEAGERDVVLVWKVSRAARHRRNWAVALDRIEVAGGTLESSTEGLDATTSSGRFARGMLAEMAAYDAEVKGEQWKEAHARRRRNGLPHSGPVRFGYVYEPGRGYVPDPVSGAVLAEMFARYLDGEGHTALARWLNRTGVPTVRAARSGWSVQAVIRVMDSGFGAGLIVRGGSRGVPRSWERGVHEPVLAEGVWGRYEQARRVRWAVPVKQREPAYVLTGLVKCGLCGLAMVAASVARPGYGAGYMYRCSGRITGGLCPGVWVTRAQVESRVLKWLGDEVAGLVEERQAKMAVRRLSAGELRLERKALVRQLVAIEGNVQRAQDGMVDGVISREDYLRQRDRAVASRAALQARVDLLDVDIGRLSGPSVSVARGLLADWDTLPVRDRRDMLAALIRRVEVRPGVRGAQDVRVVPLTQA